MIVRLYATLRKSAGTAKLEIPIEADQTVGDVLHVLVKSYSILNEAIWYDDGSLAGHVAVIIQWHDHHCCLRRGGHRSRLVL